MCNILWAQVMNALWILKEGNKNPSWPLKLEDNKSKWGRKEGCCACGKVEALCVFESKNKIINLITNIGAVNQINEAEEKDRSVLNQWKQRGRCDVRSTFDIKELFLLTCIYQIPKQIFICSIKTVKRLLMTNVPGRSYAVLGSLVGLEVSGRRTVYEDLPSNSFLTD